MDTRPLKVLLVDGPLKGQVREVPLDTRRYVVPDSTTPWWDQPGQGLDSVVYQLDDAILDGQYLRVGYTDRTEAERVLLDYEGTTEARECQTSMLRVTPRYARH
jgi:hypothetical protein